VFVLSTDDAKNERFFVNKKDRSIGRQWWLRSPGNYDHRAANVYYGDKVDGNGSRVVYENAVRPALRINLASPIFTSHSSKYEILYPVTVKVRDAASTRPIRGAEVAADSPRQKCFTGDDGTVKIKLSAGNQKIRVLAAGSEANEITLDVKPGGGSFEVDM
jgi:hypothetical protein